MRRWYKIYLQKFGFLRVLKIWQKQPKEASSTKTMFWAMLDYRVIIAHCWDVNNTNSYYVKQYYDEHILPSLNIVTSSLKSKNVVVSRVVSAGCRDLLLEECGQRVSMDPTVVWIPHTDGQVLFCSARSHIEQNAQWQELRLVLQDIIRRIGFKRTVVSS